MNEIHADATLRRANWPGAAHNVSYERLRMMRRLSIIISERY